MSGNDLDAARSQPRDGNEGSGTTNVVYNQIARADVLRRWRKTTHVIISCLRLVHASALTRKEARNTRMNYLIGKHDLVIEADRPSEDFKQRVNVAGTSNSPLRQVHSGDFDISSEELLSMSREHDYSLLQQNGGVKGVAEKLKSNLEKGLSQDYANLTNHKTHFGSNTYPSKRRPNLWAYLWAACHDATLIVLMVAAAAIIGLGTKAEGTKEGLYDGGSIALAVLIVIIFTAASDYKQSILLHNLMEEKQSITMEVIRSGRRVEISISDIVVGDVVPIKIGDLVPADGILIFGHSLWIDESSLTGESRFVYKDSSAPFLMSGCKVAEGYGTMLVTSVGLNTEWGLLMASISMDNFEETPLQIRLNWTATAVGLVGIAVAMTILVVLVVRFFAGHTENPDGSIQFKARKTKIGDAIDGFLKIFVVAVTVVIVAVPEGLPPAVALKLAYSVRKMIADKALFRRLEACETMGSATTICVDKTGILTLNQMKVVEAYACLKKICSPDNESLLPPTVVSLLIEGIANNTTGSVFAAEDGETLEISGSPTERAILRWGVDLGMNFDAARSDSVVICASPFSSVKKRAGVALISETYEMSNSKVRVHWIGAAEIILSYCTSYIDVYDCVVPMDEDMLSHFKKASENMAARSLRCVAIAYRPYEMDNVPVTTEELKNWQVPETDLVLLAVVGIKDPCRPGVTDAVKLCTTAGIRVRMVTGDSLLTARAIALECGIMGPDTDATEPILIEGKTFRHLSEVKRLEVAEKILVMGRSSPNDKLLLVQALKKKGHVVAVTGDGVYDAPALQEADIGLAMGIQGTEVAKDSSDIILLDDNFSTIVKVVRWGRSVYANVQKIILFQFTVIIASLLINIAGAVVSGNVPLNAVQLLWINLILDSLGVLALGTEPPTDYLMYRCPIGRREPLITNIMWRNIIIQALYQVTVVLALSFNGRSILNLEHEPRHRVFEVKNTLIFNSFIFCQIFNEFNARKPEEFNVLRGVTKNHLFLGVVGLTVVVQVIIIEFLGKFTSTVRLSWDLWIASIAIGFVSCPLAAVGKLIPVPEKQLNGFFAKYRPRNFSENNLHQESAVSTLKSGNIESGGRTFDLESGAEISLDEKAITNIYSASGDKLTDGDAKVSNLILMDDLNTYLSDFGFPTMGFPAIFSRIAVYPAPETIEAGKCKQKSGVFGLCALLLEFLSKAPVWSSNHNEVDLPVGVNSVVKDEDATEALYIDLVNRESASDDNDHSGEGMEEKTFNG